MNDDLEIDVSIGPNFFAPKCVDRDLKFDIRNSHAVANSMCNFRCAFCKHGLNEEKPHYKKFTVYEEKISELMNQGRMFKFTGGEPCMNPYIKQMLEVVKKNNGIVFFDTNGSMVDIIEDLLKSNLIDVLGVSLKGLTSEEAIKTSGVKNMALCWDNVLKTIKMATEYQNVRVIVTYVAYDNFGYENLCEFAKVLESLGNNIYLKINNLCGEKHRDMNLKALDMNVLPNMILEFVEKNPSWKDRVILINSSEGVTDYSKILFS